MDFVQMSALFSKPFNAILVFPKYMLPRDQSTLQCSSQSLCYTDSVQFDTCAAREWARDVIHKLKDPFLQLLSLHDFPLHPLAPSGNSSWGSGWKARVSTSPCSYVPPTDSVYLTVKEQRKRVRKAPAGVQFPHRNFTWVRARRVKKKLHPKVSLPLFDLLTQEKGFSLELLLSMSIAEL